MSRILTLSLAICAVLVSRPSVAAGADGAAAETAALDLFEQRIMPIFRSPKPSSCVQCHLSSVDLKDYILPSHRQTFVSLRDQGLVDLEHPANSKILKLIEMGAKDSDNGARLIHEKTRRAEYEAFAAWIAACCNDSGLRNLPPLEDIEPARPEQPDPVIRHARKSRVVDSFVRNVWSQRMRCFPCHTPHEGDESNPLHKTAMERRHKYEQQFGERINIFRETPEATLQYLVEQSRQSAEGELPLINLERPRASLLVLKPTSKLPARNDDGEFDPPSNAEPVSHMGGLKMHVNDQSYKAFIAWIQDYARIVAGEYRSVDDLPADNWYPSESVLRLTNAPESWPVTTNVQLFVHAWNDRDKAWETEPLAFTQGAVTPRRMVNGALFLLASDSDGRQAWDRNGATLPPGKYLVKACVDRSQRLAEDPTMLLGKESYYGKAQIQARWEAGFRHAEVIDGNHLR